jgi:hypothetical protein
MAKYLVRHVTVQYGSKNSLGQDTYESAFRGMTIELPDDPSTERLVQLGAVIPEDGTLERPGRMLALPETATDAEIINWVVGATPQETEELVRARPAMADRLVAAQEAVAARFSEQEQHLGGFKAIAEEAQAIAPPSYTVTTDNGAGLTPAPQPSTNEFPAVNSPGNVGGSPAASGRPLLADDGSLKPEDADKIVAGGAREVAQYISENPRHAQAVLDAESRRGEDPRVSVVRAAQAAASFGASTL